MFSVSESRCHMTALPLCSIVMPVFNGQRFLEAALSSVFAQSVSNFELLVIDDGSVDATPEILARFAGDARLKIITREHLGIVAALNTGLQSASTDLIVRIDADDLMAPNRLERQLAYMEANPTLGGAGSFYIIIDEFGEIRGQHEASLISVDELNRYIDAGGNPIFPHPAMIFRKSVALSLGGYREEYRKCEDVDLFLRMIQAGYFVLIQPEFLTYFRVHCFSETATSTRIQFDLNELLFYNFRRQRLGLPEVSMEQYKADLAGLSVTKKFVRTAKLQSKVILRRRDMAMLRGKRVTASLLLVGAAVCDPGATLGKIKRQIARQKGSKATAQS
jgi:glycosyltransferase involved in cell wall biosynthesis